MIAAMLPLVGSAILLARPQGALSCTATLQAFINQGIRNWSGVVPSLCRLC